ncbi:T9SS type A sorting domain-containing protein [Thermophagus sp. OGC60D27]|uniref:T9SS type A sorting domain-containing protein n=1 Tax=Thermophagus sp. OGC60D27 TaxID=3458415 RepID=UPI0040383145
MKKFYAMVLLAAFPILMESVNGQNQENKLTGVSNSSGSLKSTTIYDLIRVKIENPYLFDQAVIYFYEGFADGRGPEDSDKMFNSSEKIPEVFTRIGNENFAINGFSSLEEKNYVAIPLSVRNRVSDDCTISADLSDFTEEFDVVLEDKELERYSNLRTTSYSYTPTTIGIEHERFVLHLTRKTTARVPTGILDEESDAANIRVFSKNETLNVDISSHLLNNPAISGQIEVYHLNGRKVTSRMANAGLNQIELAGGHIYIVSVALGSQMTMKKVAVR